MQQQQGSGDPEGPLLKVQELHYKPPPLPMPIRHGYTSMIDKYESMWLSAAADMIIRALSGLWSLPASLIRLKLSALTNRRS